MYIKGFAKDILFGIAVGEALGIPFESMERIDMFKNPVFDMVGFKAYNQPSGTWSHSSALTFCVAESIANGYDLETTATNFIRWKNESCKSAKGYIFNNNNSTVRAISRLEKIINQSQEGNQSLFSYTSGIDNSNGSLMRILPLLYEIRVKNIKIQFDIIWNNSSLTHNHIRAAMCCMIYLKVAEYILNGHEKSDAYHRTRLDIKELWDVIGFDKNETKYFERLIQSDISICSIENLRSGDYVIESLETSLWCLLKSDSYKEAVLKSINLGNNTSSIGAITGGLAGLYYGYKSIPDNWIEKLTKRKYIHDLANRLDLMYS
ncbi:ADP-ribosylglycohydrolase family protein [Sporocytophaga myxococcoides]|uniref:ADP-ribosylglycohydrolase family protein n=1 Tax=Sporocytophaga myxococcoides TaxID=153721 RepID=UPI0004132B92|nr:ADP-ribosylglycohydrolase family protein [Sporocytophaga myxococcoides]